MPHEHAEPEGGVREWIMIKIRRIHHREINKIKGQLIARDGEEVYIDDAICEMIKFWFAYKGIEKTDLDSRFSP